MTQYLITGEAIGTRAQQSPYSIVASLGLGVGQSVNLTLSAQDETTLLAAGILSLPATAAAASGGPPVAYQTVAPSGGDDTANINAAIAAVVTAGQANGSNEGEVWFDLTKGPFTINGALIKNGAQAFGGTTKGNAQIPLPNIPTTSPKFTLRLRASSDGAAVWDQSRLLTQKAALVSNLVGGFDGTYGSSSMIGGPTVEQVGAAYSSNLLVVLDGLYLVTPNNMASYGVDLQNVAMARIPTIGFNGSVNPATISSLPTGGGAAIRTCKNWGESQCDIDRISVMGYTYGIVPSAHARISSAYVVYCQYGVAPTLGQSHAVKFERLVTDGCTFHLSANLLGAGPCRIDIDQWDVEDESGFAATTSHVDDAGNFLYGDTRFHRFNNAGGQTGQNAIRNGGRNMRVINHTQARGRVAPPAVPASTTALVNPFGRDAAVTVSGGTVTAITVDGTAVGLTAATVIVPEGQTIAVTYSVAPSWNWVLL